MSQNLIERNGEFIFYNFAENHVRAILDSATPYIILTGGVTEDTVKLIVPYPHRLIKIIFRQTDSSDVASFHTLSAQLRRDVGEIDQLPLGKEITQYDDKINNPDVIWTFGDGFEYESTKWTLSFIGTATNRVHPLVYLQRLGGKR